MKVYLSTWTEGSQKQTFDKRGVKRRLISYAHIRSATGKNARQMLKDHEIIETPKSAKSKTVVALNGLKGKARKKSGKKKSIPKSR